MLRRGLAESSGRRWIGLCLVLLAAFPVAAFAADGILEINQASAVASGGFPVTIAQPGSYRLTSNLDLDLAPAGTSAIEITAEDVYLDLNGFTIRGGAPCIGGAPPAGSGSGVTSVARGTTVVNGTIRGFAAHGLSLGDEARVASVQVRCAGVAGIRAGSELRLEGSRIGASAVGAELGSNALLVDNEIVGNAGFGLILGAGSALRTNVLADNNGGNQNAQFNAPQGVFELGANRCGSSLGCVGGGVCGNGVPEAGETCDDANTSSGDGCSAACSVEAGYQCFGTPSACTSEICGNGIRTGAEQCDGADLGGNSCQTFGFVGGTLSCSNTCLVEVSGCFAELCGDGLVSGSEQCDGSNLNGQSCSSFGFAGGGTLACAIDCTADVSGCQN